MKPTESIGSHLRHIDSRDVIKRIEWLDCEDPLTDLPEDEQEELANLKILQGDLDTESDWNHGLLLIREDAFGDYAREYAHDVSAIRDEETWPYTCIDWDAAATELQRDYSCVNFDGHTYWYRS